MRNQLTESEPILPSSYPKPVTSTATSLKHPYNTRVFQYSPWYLEASHQQPSACLICSAPICDNFLVFPLCGHSFHWICLQSANNTGSTFVCPVCAISEAGEPAKSPPQSELPATSGMAGDLFSSVAPSIARPRDSSLFCPLKSEARSSDTRQILDFGSPLSPEDNANIMMNSPQNNMEPYFLSAEQLLKIKATQRKLRTKLSVQQDALVRWKALAENLQHQRDDLSVDLQRALDEIRRIAQIEMKRSEMFRQTLQDQEDRFLSEITRWELEYAALHNRYERNRKRRKMLSRQLKMYTQFPCRRQRLCCHTVASSVRNDTTTQLKKLNTEVGYLSHMMKVLDSKLSMRPSGALAEMRKLSLVSELTEDALKPLTSSNWCLSGALKPT